MRKGDEPRVENHTVSSGVPLTAGRVFLFLRQSLVHSNGCGTAKAFLSMSNGLFCMSTLW